MHDSPLEGSGFELSVPLRYRNSCKEPGFARLFAGGRWIRTFSTAARKPRFPQDPGTIAAPTCEPQPPLGISRKQAEKGRSEAENGLIAGGDKRTTAAERAFGDDCFSTPELIHSR